MLRIFVFDLFCLLCLFGLFGLFSLSGLGQALPVYRKDLRNLYEVEQHKIKTQMILADFNHIIELIYQEAKRGHLECDFDVRCAYKNLINGQCILTNEENGFPFELTYYTRILLQKINHTFPDSQIVRLKAPCCTYRISW